MVTQQEQADSIGVSFQTISKWETGIDFAEDLINKGKVLLLCRHEGLEKNGRLNSQYRAGIMQSQSGLHI